MHFHRFRSSSQCARPYDLDVIECLNSRSYRAISSGQENIYRYEFYQRRILESA